MRVPELSPTAGYAAPLENSLSRQGIHCALQAPASAHSKDESLARPRVAENLSWCNGFASSADEFVKKALSSTTAKSRQLTSPNCNTPFWHPGRGSAYAAATLAEEQDLPDGESDSSNTYCSFKESYNISKAIFDDCININAFEFLGGPSSDTDVDPIIVINTELSRDDANDNLVDQFHECPQPDSNLEDETAANFINGRKARVENQRFTTTQDARCAWLVHPTEETDCDDNSLLDQCDSYDGNDADECITSGTSSSISWCPAKHSYFPRGIINPNYPGFQHLAHTLSDHFVGNIPSDSYDSDMSEYDMELSLDIFDTLPGEGDAFQSELNSCNNNNNNNRSAVDMEVASASTTAEQHRAAQKKHHIDEKQSGMISLSDANCNSETVDVDLSINLQLMLSFLSPSKCCTPAWKVHDVRSAKTLEPREKPPDINDDCNAESVKCSWATPDILIDNHKPTPDIPMTKANRPDLLRGVSPRSPASASKDNDVEIVTTQALVRSIKCSDSEVPKDETGIGATPVDIIGDFGQEVEREFGLLVSGYRRLTDSSINHDEVDMQFIAHQSDKVSDALLSVAKDEIDGTKFLTALGHAKDDTEYDHRLQQLSFGTTSKMSGFLGECNVVDLSVPSSRLVESSCRKHDDFIHIGGDPQRKYQRQSYDDRQLPPVGIDYKRCHQNMRNAKRQHTAAIERPPRGKPPNIKVTRNNAKFSFHHSKRPENAFDARLDMSKETRRREEAELYEYHQLISNKELILRNSRYTKLSTWAQYLQNSVKDGSAMNISPPKDLISLSALDLFDAYKIGTEIDVETLQKHFEMAKEIENKRRSDREEIRRRLAMAPDENRNESAARTILRPNLPSRSHNGINFSKVKDASSDTESHSSDSETCPKLSKVSQQNKLDFYGLREKPTHQYQGRPLSVSCLNANKQSATATKACMSDLQGHVQMPPISNEDEECEFFTKQARLQIEARMALAQAKGMAHMQMEIDRQNQRVSPITEIIRGSLGKVGMQMALDKRRVSRQMLTEMGIPQLQILVNSLHTHIEDLNESLVHSLLQRDDLHMGQDVMLADIEELSRYISAQEQLGQQNKRSLHDVSKN